MFYENTDMTMKAPALEKSHSIFSMILYKANR